MGTRFSIVYDVSDMKFISEKERHKYFEHSCGRAYARDELSTLTDNYTCRKCFKPMENVNVFLNPRPEPTCAADALYQYMKRG